MVRYRNQFRQEPEVEPVGKVVDITVKNLPDETSTDLFDKKELQERYKNELKELCEQLEIDSSGTKSELIERIIGTYSNE